MMLHDRLSTLTARLPMVVVSAAVGALVGPFLAGEHDRATATVEVQVTEVVEWPFYTTTLRALEAEVERLADDYGVEGVVLELDVPDGEAFAILRVSAGDESTAVDATERLATVTVEEFNAATSNRRSEAIAEITALRDQVSAEFDRLEEELATAIEADAAAEAAIAPVAATEPGWEALRFEDLRSSEAVRQLRIDYDRAAARLRELDLDADSEIGATGDVVRVIGTPQVQPAATSLPFGSRALGAGVGGVLGSLVAVSVVGGRKPIRSREDLARLDLASYDDQAGWPLLADALLPNDGVRVVGVAGDDQEARTSAATSLARTLGVPELSIAQATNGHAPAEGSGPVVLDLGESSGSTFPIGVAASDTVVLAVHAGRSPESAVRELVADLRRRGVEPAGALLLDP